MAAGDVLVPIGSEGAANERAQQEAGDGKCYAQSSDAIGHYLEKLCGKYSHVVAQQGELDDSGCNRPDEGARGEDLSTKRI